MCDFYRMGGIDWSRKWAIDAESMNNLMPSRARQRPT